MRCSRTRQRPHPYHRSVSPWARRSLPSGLSLVMTIATLLRGIGGGSSQVIKLRELRPWGTSAWWQLVVPAWDYRGRASTLGTLPWPRLDHGRNRVSPWWVRNDALQVSNDPTPRARVSDRLGSACQCSETAAIRILGVGRSAPLLERPVDLALGVTFLGGLTLVGDVLALAERELQLDPSAPQVDAGGDQGGTLGRDGA